MTKFIVLILFCSIPGPLISFADTDGAIQLNKDPRGAITLRKAVPLALMHNPELEAFSLERRVREARALQAGLLPNPKLQFMVEDAVGSGQFSGFGGSQTTLQLSQLVELGGKRAARLRVGNLSTKLADWDYETKRMDVLTAVTKAFIELLKGQQKVSLSNDLVQLGKKFLAAVSERVRAGKIAEIEKVKAEVVLSSKRIKLERALRDLKVARRNLSVLWGSVDPQFGPAEGNLFQVMAVPPLESLIERVNSNPDLARWTTELEQRQAVLDSELAKKVPDLTLHGGVRRLEQTNDNALVFGVSMPLQFFDRNQGGIEEARQNLAKADAEKKAAEVQVNKMLLEAYNSLVFYNAQVVSIKTRVLPGAQKAFDGVNEGYQFGKFGFLDVLDSQKTLFEVRGQYLDALEKYHKAVADLERVTGEPLAYTSQPLTNAGERGRP